MNSIHEEFQKVVKINPGNIAIRFEGQDMSYQYLNEKSNQLAYKLLDMGVERGQPIGLLMNRSMEMIISLIAILKAGGAYVPIDLTYPKGRMEYMISDANLNIILTSENERGILPEKYVNNTLIVDLLKWGELRNYSTQNNNIKSTQDSLAYINYTSGSTGTPKGVMTPHRGVIRLVKKSRFIDFEKKEVFLQFSTTSFDAATFEIWGSLLNGSKLIIYPKEFKSVEQFGELINKEEVTILWLTTSLFHQIAETHLSILTNVKTVLTGGDVLSSVLAKKVVKNIDGINLVHAYGPTENTTFTTCFKISSIEQIGDRVSIGEAVAKTEMYILDNNLNRVQHGEVGELCVAGEGLALGYLNKPEETKSKFINNPFGEGLMYRTGDLVRQQIKSKNLEFLGRIDDQVKIRGFRIELSEVEIILKTHGAVEDAVVIALESELGGKHLNAYLKLRKQNTDIKLIRKDLKSMLPHFMIPSNIFVIEEFPLKSSGKIDKKKLVSIPKNDHIDDIPESEIEKILFKVWEDLFHTKDINKTITFIEHGGDSLLATKAISKINEIFNIKVSIKYFFKESSILELAMYIEKAIEVNPINQKLDTTSKKNELKNRIPLTSQQQQMLILESMSNDIGVYNVYTLLKLEGKLNVKKLKESIESLIDYQKNLKTKVRVDDTGNYYTEVINDQTFEWKVMKVNEEYLEYIKKEARRPFNLMKDSYVRSYLFKKSSEVNYLLLVMPHFIIDGWSMEIFSRELSLLYNTNTKFKINELEFNYSDYAIRQDLLNQEIYNEDLKYWKKKLKGAPQTIKLPYDYSRPASMSFEGRNHRVILDAKLSEEIKTYAINNNTTVFNFMMSLFQILLSKISNTNNFLIGTHMSGRNSSHIDNIIGYFINTTVIKAELNKKLYFKELLKIVEEDYIEAYEHQHLPFNILVKEITHSRITNKNPIFQTGFLLQNNSSRRWNFNNIKISEIPLHNNTSKFDLLLVVEEKSKEFVCEFEYNNNLFHEETIKRFGDIWVDLINIVIKEPNKMLGDIKDNLKLDDYSNNSVKIINTNMYNELLLDSKELKESQDRLLNIYKEIMDTNNINIYDNFFEIGGHSLLALKIISRINEIGDEKITVQTFFEFPTIDSLSRNLVTKKANELTESNNTKPKNIDNQIDIESLTDEDIESLLNFFED